MSDSEIFFYKPNNSNTKLSVWMGFPGPESFAMSSLGYLWMYKLMDENENIFSERIYSDTKKTQLNIKDVDIFGFSFSFDMDFLNIFKMLEKYNIPLKSKNRDENQPLIFAGGPVVSSNPEPYKEIFDFIIIGDGEEINKNLLEIYIENIEKSKDEILKELSKSDGIYVPKFTKNKVKKLTTKLDYCVHTPIISPKAFFPNTFILEVARGCANRCGFCLASYLNLPFRFVPYDEIIKIIDMALNHTKNIALLGAQLSAHPKFNEICDYISKKIEQDNEIKFSVSSLRVDSITPQILKPLVLSGQNNITLAIEAGSERLRKVINKNLSEEQILNAIDIASKSGLKGFKFYGMLGLPTETYEDLEALINLTKKIKSIYKGFKISFGFSTFVPKANTPFQWIGREDTKSLENKISHIKKEMHKIGVEVSISSAKWDYWQAVLSRGDSSLTDFLIDVYKQGGKLGAFKSSAKKFKINTDKFALKNHNFEEELPWDIIELMPDKKFLISECKRLCEDYNGL